MAFTCPINQQFLYRRAAIALKFWNLRHRDSKAGAIIHTFFKNLHHENPDRRVFAVGYSWGARQAMLLASKKNSISNDGSGYVDAIYVASPCELMLSTLLKQFLLGIAFRLFRTCPTDFFDIISGTLFS